MKINLEIDTDAKVMKFKENLSGPEAFTAVAYLSQLVANMIGQLYSVTVPEPPPEEEPKSNIIVAN